jgi:hypothetical protein
MRKMAIQTEAERAMRAAQNQPLSPPAPPAPAVSAEQDRTPREMEARTTETRPAAWAPPDLLPEPRPEPGFTFRWIRTSSMGEADPTNVSRQFREGWVPVRAEDHPELMLMANPTTRFVGNVEVGGLLLCKIPASTLQQRADYYANLTAQQMHSVDNNFMRESDNRMPLFRERNSKTTFGRGTPR